MRRKKMLLLISNFLSVTVGLLPDSLQSNYSPEAVRALESRLLQVIFKIPEVSKVHFCTKSPNFELEFGESENVLGRREV